MYNCLVRIKSILFLWIMVLLSVGPQVFSFDLDDEISSKFKRYYDIWYSDSYLDTQYAPVYPKDPFNDAIEDIEDRSMQLKVAWAEYVEKVLKWNNCSLSQKKLWSMLYYFVPEFRTELARALKSELGDYDSKKFVFDYEKIQEYCREYYICNKSAWYSAREIFKEWVKGNDIRGVWNMSSGTPVEVMTNCEEFFKRNYRKWQSDEENRQNVQVSQLWVDKFWNSTMNDSPYDIMIDFWSIWRLLFTEAEQPISPVVYDLPMFSNSKKSLKDHEKNGSSYSITKTSWKSKKSDSTKGTTIWVSNLSSAPLPLPLPHWAEGISMEDSRYDDLIDWLWAYRVAKENSLYYWSLCEDADEEPEPGPDYNQDSPSAIKMQSLDDEFSDISEKEFEEIIDYMKWAVDKYATLPGNKNAEMKDKAWDTSRFLNSTSASQLETTANQIKSCWQWCEWLRVDQYASCVIMCTCGEIDSPIFDSEDNPWLWPIFKIRFCAVPAVDTKFSVWWKKIVSVEEWVREIYWAVDKLSREGKLWMWTQQYNFLDSSTKKMKVADTVAFSIDIEFVDIFDNFSKHSDQYKKRELVNRNKAWQEDHHISNRLDNPVLKNRYRLFGKQGEVTSDVSAQANAEWTRQSQSNLMEWPSIINPEWNSRASHYNDEILLLNKWLDQQANLWEQTLEYIKSLTDSSMLLDGKKKLKYACWSKN